MFGLPHRNGSASNRKCLAASQRKPRQKHRFYRTTAFRPLVERLEDRVVPTITLSVNSPIDEGQSASLTGTISDPPTADFSVSLNWGDGSQQTLNLAGGTASFSASHVYQDNSPSGSYQISAGLLGTGLQFGHAFAL